MGSIRIPNAVLYSLLLPFRAQHALGLIVAMAVVTPKELTAGVARGQTVRGRVRMFALEKKGKSDCAECHLVVEAGLSGALYIEAWRDQANRFGQVAKEGMIVELTHLTIKAMGDKMQWQCTNLDVYGQVMSTTTIRVVEHDDGSCPADLHTVFVRDLHFFHKVPHMINIVAILVDAVAPATQKATAPAFNIVLGDEQHSVRVAIWKDHAATVDKDSSAKGSAVVLTNLRVTRGKDNSTEIGSSRRSQLQTAPKVMADQLLERTKQPAELVSISGHYSGQDYSAAEATPIHLSALTSLIVPNQTRDFAGEVYVVYHCLVEDIEPVFDADGIFYMGCPVCKKKQAIPPQCEHAQSPVPHYLGTCTIAAFEHRTQAKAIGNVLQTLLGIPAAACIGDGAGYSTALETALDTLRGTPYNIKFILGTTADGSKNVLELVHAIPTLDLTTGMAAVPSSVWRLIDSEMSGIPPCHVASLQLKSGFYLLHDKPVTNLQVMVTLADTGEEHGAMEKDDTLVRVRRAAICSMSGAPVVVHRTGDLGCMSKYLRWNKGDVLFMVVRILHQDSGVWHFAVKGSKRFADAGEATIFNTYFTQYCLTATSAFQQEPLVMEHGWTPKKRRRELSADSGSRGELTPRTFESTPIKFGTP